MAVLNDFGEAGYTRVKNQLDAFAAQLGIQKEVIYGFFNETGHLPQTLGELEAWGNKVTKYGVARRDQGTGGWSPIMPGVNPDPRLTAQDRGGFAHNITNAEDSDVQRFQTVDPSGNIWGGSWDPAYNAAHPNAGPANPNTLRGDATTRMNAQSGNPYPPGSPLAATWDSANPAPGQAGTATPTASPSASPGGSTAPGASAGGGIPGAAGRIAQVDANAYGNTQTLQAQIDDAIRRYALARTAEERNQAYMDLQRWQTELGKAQNDQQRYDAMAQALLSASVQLQNNPRDWMKFNQYTSGGRDIFAQMQHAGPAFGGPTGPIEPGSVNDLLSRLGITPGPATPATPAPVQVGAQNPHNPELPNIPIPGTPGGPPSALQPGAAGVPAAGTPTTALPSYEQMLAELDKAAGGSWSGNRADRPTVARTWWDANPSRRGQPMPAWS